MSVTIYHNPRCAKSRATLKLLEDRGLKPNVIEYLKTPPSETELRKLIDMLGIAPRALLRTKETEYKQLKLDNPTLSDARILHAMAKHPKLIEHPIIVVSNDVQGHTSVAGGRKPGATNKAALGRPPERVFRILDRSSGNCSVTVPDAALPPASMQSSRRCSRRPFPTPPYLLHPWSRTSGIPAVARRGSTSALQGRSNAARGPGWPGAASIPGAV